MILNESEQVKGEVFKPTERIKLYVLEVKDTNKGPRITVSRTHPDLVKRLFESEVAQVKDGTASRSKRLPGRQVPELRLQCIPTTRMWIR